jgi:NAD(P)-dependent dehydrogenase (short-subunit alcohol dehydrogenase family)
METVMTASDRPDRHQLVVVTGGSTGMGAATARELAGRGYHVLAGVRRDVDADALRADGIEPHILDITDESDVAAIAGRVADDPLRRPLRALINNAGIALNAPVETLPIAEWRNLFEVNLFGHIAMTQALLPALLQSSGTVVNISSVGGKFAMATYGPYAIPCAEKLPLSGSRSSSSNPAPSKPKWLNMQWPAPIDSTPT